MKSRNEIISITKGPRLANFELLRILAMFFVLVVHADFWALGEPSHAELINNTVSALTRVGIEAISIICVNLFIMISGWFKIRASLKGFLNFIFQCLFFSFLLYAFALLSNHTEFSFKGLRDCLYLTTGNWFVKAYLALYLISPVLNAFIENSSEKNFRYVLISLFTFQTIFGLTGTAVFIQSGLSCFSFICLYLLSSYIRMYVYTKYHGNVKLANWGGAIICVSTTCNISIWIIGSITGIPLPVFSYISPIVILQTAGFIIVTNCIKIKSNKVITVLAESCFAVYLIHSNGNFRNDFKEIILKIYEQNTGISTLIYIFILLVLIYVASIAIDKIRLFIWNKLNKR